MKTYVKPIIEMDALVADTRLANDPMLYADEIYGDEVSVPAGDWDDFFE
ncbi:MAG: hypothetical protein IJA41_07475 [Clostridia bacterium]|nr:hypothetical protein [Clostridia bacterium]